MDADRTSSAATTESRLAAVDAILAEIELTGYGMGRGPSQPSIRGLARRARNLLRDEHCPGWPNCRCNKWASPSDPHGAFGPPGMMGG